MGSEPGTELNMNIEDIHAICMSMGHPRQAGVVDRDTFKDRITGLENERFSGAVCLTFNYNGVLSSQWIVLEHGEIIAVFLEEDIRRESKKRTCDMMAVPGYLEVFEFTDAQLDELSQVFGTCFSKWKHVPSGEEVARCRKTFTIMREDLRKMFGRKIAEGVIRKHLTMNEELQSIYSRKMAMDALKTQISRLNIDMARPCTADIEELIDAIKENVLVKFLGPQLAEKSANKYRSILFLGEVDMPTREEILSNPVLAKMNLELEKVLKDRSIDVLKAHILDLNININNITRRDIEMLIERIHTKVLKKILGTKKAGAFARRMRGS